MDFLKAEIERKKRQISEKNVMQPEKKYFKRGDLVAVQEKEYLGQHGAGLAAASLTKPATAPSDKTSLPGFVTGSGVAQSGAESPDSIATSSAFSMA